jgi:hypothetical protein
MQMDKADTQERQILFNSDGPHARTGLAKVSVGLQRFEQQTHGARAEQLHSRRGEFSGSGAGSGAGYIDSNANADASLKWFGIRRPLLDNGLRQPR